MNQTGVVLVPGRNEKTYEIKGSSQVPLHEKNEKRAFTAVLLVSTTEEVLPTQSVQKEKTKNSQPSEDACKLALEKGHQFVSNPNTHWNFFKTSKDG